MQEAGTAEADRPPGVSPPLVCDHPVEGLVDLSRRVRSPDAGVFAALADPVRFAQVGTAFGAVWWPGDIDLAPDAMHAELKAAGKWAL